MAGTNLLTDTKIKNAKAEERPYKLTDGEGMYLLVNPDGSKYWRLKYRFEGKEKLLALGVYDEVSLKSARAKRADARATIAAGVDPVQRKRDGRDKQRRHGKDSFEAVAREWYSKRSPTWSAAHRATVIDRLERILFPKLGGMPIATVDATAILAVLREIEKTGRLEVLTKVRVIAGQVMRYALAEPSFPVTSDPTRDLRGIFQTRDVRHYARLGENDLPAFLTALDAYDGMLRTQLAIRLLMLTFVRTGELRGAQWSEFDRAKREFRIPPERMKNGQPHIVPLSDQALAVYERLAEISESKDFVFPNEHRADAPMSENTILFALYRMGYRGRATGHGFRATASTLLNEQGWNSDWIEKQLAHATSKDKIRGTYNYAEYLPGRRQMMQAWADFLDAKRAAGEKIVSLHRKRA